MARKNDLVNDVLGFGAAGAGLYHPVAGLTVRLIQLIYNHCSNNDYDGDIPEDRIKNYKERNLSQQSFKDIVNENKIIKATEVYARKQRVDDAYYITLIYGTNSEPFPPKKNNNVVIIANTLDDYIYNLFGDDELIVIPIKRPKQGVSISDVSERVKQIVIAQLGVDEEEVTPEASFTNDLGADGLDTVELVMQFEKEFNIYAPDDVWERLTTVGEVVRYIEKLFLQQAKRVQISGF